MLIQQTKSKSCLPVLAGVLLYLCFTPSVIAGDQIKSQDYLVEGVYYLISEGNRDKAEEQFRKVIFSSSASALSVEDSHMAKIHDQNRWAVAEAFYFLGKIYYEKALFQGDIAQNIAQARKYLRKAEEYGVVHDRLHPPLLDEINKKYPEVKMPVPKPGEDKAKVTIEIDQGAYRMDAVKIDHLADVTERGFLTNKEFDLECGARYKVKPDIRGGYESVYKALTVFGIGLAVWLTR